VKKVEVKIQKTNPQPPQSKNNVNNPQANPAILELQKQIEYLQQQLQQLQKQNNLSYQNPQPQTNNSGEFIIKSHMKASFVALKVEQVLLLKKTAMISAVGYSIPVALDSVFLIKKDLTRMGKDVIISFELFEKQFTQKTVTGLRIALKLQ